MATTMTPVPMAVEAVREVILKPMLKLFQAPQHLRSDAKAYEQAIATYEQVLERFDQGTLERAWEKVVADQRHWLWPNPGVIVATCRQCQARAKTPSEEEQRQAKAREMAEAYVNRYMGTSHLAGLAKRDGWAGRLGEYVADVAWVQAQLICKVRHIGWNTRLADRIGQFHSSQEAFQAFREMPAIRKAVELGQIRVMVPPARIREWKESSRRGKQAIADSIS